ncbi:MAG: tripartite tricarboxylate transporter substrate binding protein [Burkholderiaceae bacterium]
MIKKLAYLTALGLSCWVATTAQAQTPFPTKAIRIIVPFAAGGTSDILARSLGLKLTESWGQPVVVENRAGANGNVGADHVAKSAPDGYTLLLSDVGALAINPSVYPNMPYDPVRDFAPVNMVSYSPHVLGVHPSVPANNVKELIDYAKANPGKLNFAISGTGGAPHLAGIAFAQRTGISWTYIPYKGGSQAVADVAGGQANVIMNGMLATYPTVKSGRIRALALSGAQRVASASDVPTIAETLPGFETGSYQGVLAPAGTPRDVIAKLNAEISKILASSEMREKLAVLGTEVRTGQPEALGSFIAGEKSRWAQVIREAGVKFD